VGEMGLKEKKINIIIVNLANARRRYGSRRSSTPKQEKKNSQIIMKAISKNYGKNSV
jgi:hypothetical protein